MPRKYEPDFLTNSMEYWQVAVKRADDAGLGSLVDKYRPTSWDTWETYYTATDALNGAIEAALMEEAEKHTVHLKAVRTYVVNCKQHASRRELVLLDDILACIDKIVMTVEEEILGVSIPGPTDYQITKANYDAGYQDYTGDVNGP